MFNYLRSELQDLIKQAEFDAIESLSLPGIGGDMTLAEAKEAFPGKAILPNFPANLATKSRAEIEEFVTSLLAEAGSDLPFMLQISEDLPEGAWSNALPAICRAISK